MSFAEFLLRLAKTHRSWRIVNGRYLRNGLGECPVEAVARTPSPTYQDAAVRIGLSPSDAWAISEGADVPGAYERPKLLAACGLDAEAR